MKQGNIGYNSDGSQTIPVKRRRGRPRKDQALNRVNVARVTDHSLNRVDTTQMPPEFARSNWNQSHRVDSNDDTNDGMVGQPVTGVVEASFGDGYLISVMIGNSNTSFRGAVFKPGHFVQITAENDVAPNVPMIQRNEVHHPAATQTRAPSRSRERTDQHANYVGNGILPSNQVHQGIATSVATPKGKNASMAAAPSVPHAGARGTIFPVVLQPENVSNGLAPARTTVSKDIHVHTVAPLAVYLPDGSNFASQVPGVAKTSQIGIQNMQNENVSYDQGTVETLQWQEDKSVKLNDVLKLEGVQGSLNVEPHVENSNRKCNSSTQEAPVAPKRDIGDIKERSSLFDTLQSAVSDYHNRSASVIKPSASRTGRMTELLQAVQENMMENQVPQRGKLTTDSDTSAFR